MDRKDAEVINNIMNWIEIKSGGELTCERECEISKCRNHQFSYFFPLPLSIPADCVCIMYSGCCHVAIFMLHSRNSLVLAYSVYQVGKCVIDENEIKLWVKDSIFFLRWYSLGINCKCEDGVEPSDITEEGPHSVIYARKYRFTMKIIYINLLKFFFCACLSSILDIILHI